MYIFIEYSLFYSAQTMLCGGVVLLYWLAAVCHLCPLVHPSVRVSACRERGGREAEMAERQRWNERENERITRSVNGGLCLLATPGVVCTYVSLTAHAHRQGVLIYCRVYTSMYTHTYICD